MKEITKKVYYSELLNKEFDSVEELNKAEEEKKAAEAVAIETNSKKKELAKSIESSDAKIETAKKEYVDIRNEFEKRYREFKGEYNRKLAELEKERDNTLSEKAKEIRQYTDERYDALYKYTKEFGVYKKYLTGEDAEKERKKILNSIFSVFPTFWDIINW